MEAMLARLIIAVLVLGAAASVLTALTPASATCPPYCDDVLHNRGDHSGKPPPP
jgi:hypothetical protein